jgi:hypothetical protein
MHPQAITLLLHFQGLYMKEEFVVKQDRSTLAYSPYTT